MPQNSRKFSPKTLNFQRTGVPHTPGFPVKFGGLGALHAAFLNESRTRGRLLGPRTGNSGISLVFREMWDPRTLTFFANRANKTARCSAVVSHISRETSEIWGTRRFVAGTELGSGVIT